MVLVRTRVGQKDLIVLVSFPWNPGSMEEEEEEEGAAAAAGLNE